MSVEQDQDIFSENTDIDIGMDMAVGSKAEFDPSSYLLQQVTAPLLTHSWLVNTGAPWTRPSLRFSATLTVPTLQIRAAPQVPPLPPRISGANWLLPVSLFSQET